MPIITIILLVIIFIRTISYGIFELKQNKNKSGAITVFFIAIVGLVFPIIEILFNYYI